MACIMSTYSRKKICCVRKAFRSPILSHHKVTPNYAGFSVQIGVLCFSEPKFWAINPGTKLGNSSREKEAVDPWLTLKRITWSPLLRILTYLVHVVSTNFWYFSVQFSSVVQSCPTLCDCMNCSTPGLPVHHQLLEFIQTHVHRVGDAIQPSHPLILFSSCPQSLPASESFPVIPLLKENFHHLKLCLTRPLACFLFHSSWK